MATAERVAAYAEAFFSVIRAEDTLGEVEDELFRLARILEGNDELMDTLADPHLEPARRQQVVTDLLVGKARPATISLVGLVVGAGIGAVAAASDDSSWKSLSALVFPPMFGGIGAFIGVIVDAKFRRDSNLYRRTGPARISLSPALGPRHRSVAISVWW